MENKPTFFESLRAGVYGMAKGALMLGGIGLVVGGGVGALIGALPGVSLFAGLAGAALFAEMGMLVGGVLGAFTGIAQSREQGVVSAEDVVNVANISFAQGVEAGRSQTVCAPAKENVIEAAKDMQKPHFQTRLAAEKLAPPQAGIPGRS